MNTTNTPEQVTKFHLKVIMVAYVSWFVAVLLALATLQRCGSHKCGCYSTRGKCGYGIIKQIPDERGLTSVQYNDAAGEWALDYLTPHELDSLKKTF